MADHHPAEESLIEKITEKFHGRDSSSSSDSDEGRSEPSVIKAKIYRLFGREQPVHKVLGGGKPADLFLWRDKKVSAAILGGVTAIWVIFELLGYHLLTLVCHSLIVSLAVLFLWSYATTCMHNSPPHIPEVSIPEDLTVNIVLSLRYEMNRGLVVLREIALGRDLKKFLAIIAGLWVLSVLGSCCNFLTLFYIVFIALHTVPALYEKYEDKVDSFVEKAEAEIKKQYAIFDARVLSKIPRGPLKAKKF